MIKYIVLISVLTCSSLAKAQNDSLDIHSKKIVKHPKSAIRWYPLFLLNRFPTIQLGYEFNTSRNINIELNAGIIMRMFDDDTEVDFIEKQGIKSGLQVRKYLSTSRMNTFFMSVGADYFYIQYDRSRTFGFNCVNQGNCAFFQFDEYRIIRQDRRINSKIGILTEVDDNFSLELALGIALNSRKFRTLNKISGFDIQYGDRRFEDEVDELVFQPLFSVNIVYKLR